MKRLGIFSLRHRRLRGDMIEAFKIIHDIDKVNLGKLFCVDEDERTRKQFVFRRHVNSNIRLKFFTRSVINYYWNYLIDEVVSCKFLSTLKIKL